MDPTPRFTLSEQKYVQQMTGKLNWYARAVDGTMFTSNQHSNSSTSQADASTNNETSATFP
jgi:hypothetical protein